MGFSSGSVTGAFGLGAMGRGNSGGSGGSAGGGGFFGGGASTRGHGGGGGGSSYIANSSLYEKVMYCYKCAESSLDSTKTVSTTNVTSDPISKYAKIGYGYAKITYIGDNDT